VFLSVTAILLALAASSSAQEPIPQFSSRTDLILLDVVVRDGAGGFVHGLSPADFTVLEDGQPRPVEALSYERIDDAPPAVVPGGVAPPASLPLLTSSGAAAPGAGGLRLIVLFFDFTSLDADGTARAIEMAQEHVDRRMEPADRVAVAALGQRFEIEQDFTSDAAALTAALGRIRLFNRDLLPEASGGGEETEAEEGVPALFAGDEPLQAIRVVARALADAEGRKAIVYIAGGLGHADNDAQLRAAVNAAVRSRVQIYPVEMRGLEATPPLGGADRPSVSGVALYSGQAVFAQAGARAASRQMETALAVETGGRAFYASNDFARALTQVHADTAEYYLLGYRSANPTRDGRFRRIEVRVGRRGVRVEYRRGYYSEVDFRAMTPDDRARQLEGALAAELPATDLPLRVWAGAFRASDDEYLVPVSVFVPAREPAGAGLDSSARSVDFVGEVRDSEGRPVARVRGAVELPRRSAGSVGRNAQYNAGFILSRGQYRMKFVVRDNADGRLGAFESAVEVPDSSANADVLSTVALGAELQPVRGGPVGRPLVWGDRELVPNVSGVFSQDHDLYVYFEVAAPSDEKRRAPVVRLLRDAAVAATALPDAASRRPLPERGAVAYLFRIPLDRLDPGGYWCEISVADPPFMTAGSAQVPLEVRGAQ
jgi:VWFA-related protein